MTKLSIHEGRKLLRASAPTRKVKRDYKREFLDQLHLAGLPQPEAEYYFARPRRWRFDWAYVVGETPLAPSPMVAIEYQGGNYTGGVGGHKTIKGLRNDYEKFTEAALRGWMLILIDSESVRDGRALAWVERALNSGARISR